MQLMMKQVCDGCKKLRGAAVTESATMSKMEWTAWVNWVSGMVIVNEWMGQSWMAAVW